MIEIVELIKVYNRRLNHLPDDPPHQEKEVLISTLTHLNAYRATTEMLQDLAKNAPDLKAEEDTKP